MKYAKFGDHYVLKLDRGDEVVEKLTNFVREKSITAGFISGIGAVSDITLGFFDPETRDYHKENFSGSYEVSNICGNIARLDGQEMLHIHATVADWNHNGKAGHLFSAKVSVTLEVVIFQFPGILERTMDEEIGLNLLALG